MDENRTDEYQNTSGTGNGTYQYSQGSTNQGGDGYQSSYSSGYQSNGSGSASGNGGSHHNNKKHGGGGKVAFAIALAAVFGVCAGAGAYGISRVSGAGTSSVAEASTDASTEGATLSIAENDNSSSTDASTEAASSDASTESASEDSSTSASASLGLQTSNAEAQEDTVTKIVEEDMPSIVAVYNNFTSTSQDFFGQTYSQEQTATGSGIIIGETDDELLIVTNNHVVADEDSLQVQFVDESTADANIKGTDSDMDLAVIAVKLSDLSDDTKNAISIATLGNSDNLKVGQSVIAIGNALGYGQSVTTGVVSALNREIADSENGTTNKFIQTDAAINPGNSGGALIDLNGNVIGINSSKIGATTVEGMCYAIPISDAIPVIETLMNQSTKTKVSDEDKGYLGIQGVSVTSQVASAYNMPEGVYVASVMDGTGAADAGLQKGDIITKINGSSVSDMEDLQDQLRYYAAGTEVTLTIERNNSDGQYEEKELKVTLSDSSAVSTDESSSSSGSSDSSSSSQGSSQGQYYYSFPWNQW